MKSMLARWLSAMLALCLLLSLSPAALMEELPEAQAEVVEEAAPVVVEEENTEPSEEVTADSVENTEPEAVDETVEEVMVEAVDEIVEEQSVDLYDVPMLEAQSDDDELDLDAMEPQPDESEEAIMFSAQKRVEISPTNFTDSNFLNYVKTNFDWNLDNWLSDDEINAVTEIKFPHHYDEGQGREVCQNQITNLYGIEQFPELLTLDCAGNEHLEEIDISKNTKLESLECYDCGLTSLDTSKNTALTWLDCSNNNLDKLDVSKNTLLKGLYCTVNRLTSLNLSNNKELVNLLCASNKLETLNTGNCTKLEELGCWNNKLSALNVSNNKLLTYLSCEGNNIAELDISELAKIVPFVKDQYKRKDEYGYVVYVEKVVKNEGDEYYEGVEFWCDKATKLITSKPAPAPAPAPASAPAGPIIPVISAVRRRNSATITAAPGTYCYLDLGGAIGKGFKSSRKKVATVDSTGVVTIKGGGKTKITFKVGKKKRQVTLKVIDSTVPTRVTLNITNASPVNAGGIYVVKVGDTINLSAELPAGTNSGIKWKSNKKKVAKVTNGVVTFKKTGKVTITATCKRGKKKASIRFRVGK